MPGTSPNLDGVMNDRSPDEVTERELRGLVDDVVFLVARTGRLVLVCGCVLIFVSQISSSFTCFCLLRGEVLSGSVLS